MLHITIPTSEQWDESTEEFIHTKAYSLTLEHSLVSISKWESLWKKPFLTKDPKTTEETLSYIKCMTVTQNVSNDIYNFLTVKNIDAINKYIEEPMTATTVYTEKKAGNINKEPVTAELIYYWMISLNIPFECQKWHLNKLLTLISVCNKKNTPPSKRSKRQIMTRNSELNAARRKQLNTKG